jgi:phage baseplate assembly protein gpV
MKKLLNLVCTLAIGTAAFAAPVKTAPKTGHYTGTIETYDAATHTLTVKHDGKSTTFTVGDKAEVMKGKSKADASSLTASAGQGVKVDFVIDGANRTAQKIAVSAAHSSASAKK